MRYRVGQMANYKPNRTKSTDRTPRFRFIHGIGLRSRDWKCKQTCAGLMSRTTQNFPGAKTSFIYLRRKRWFFQDCTGGVKHQQKIWYENQVRHNLRNNTFITKHAGDVRISKGQW